MTTRSHEQAQRACERRLAASLVYDARIKDFEAACWLGLPGNLEDARANVHSSLDGVLDQTLSQITAIRDQHETKER